MKTFNYKYEHTLIHVVLFVLTLNVGYSIETQGDAMELSIQECKNVAANLLEIDHEIEILETEITSTLKSRKAKVERRAKVERFKYLLDLRSSIYASWENEKFRKPSQEENHLIQSVIRKETDEPILQIKMLDRCRAIVETGVIRSMEDGFGHYYYIFVYDAEWVVSKFVMEWIA